MLTVVGSSSSDHENERPHDEMASVCFIDVMVISRHSSAGNLALIGYAEVV